MRKLLKRTLALLLCLAMLAGFAVVPQVNAQAIPDPDLETMDAQNHVIYGVAGETSYVPAGYTYVYENEEGEVYSQQMQTDTYISMRVLTSQEAEALANLEYNQQGYVLDADGQNLICKNYDAQAAMAYSEAVRAILEGKEVTEGDQVSVRYAPYTDKTPVRALITLEAEPVIRMSGMNVALGSGLGTAELQAVEEIETQQLAVLSNVEDELGYAMEIEGQFTLLTNAVAVTVNYGDLAAINQMDGVKSAILMPWFEAPELDGEILEEGQLLPNMKYAGPGMGATEAWDVGYKGEGMSVAIIDTGLALVNPAFAIMPTDPEAVAYTKDNIAQILNNNELHAEKLVSNVNVDKVYYSEKVPYGFNYAENKADFGNDTVRGHGTHVAGIVAGNLSESMKEQTHMETMGIAPEAQIVVMKVFNSKGECFFDWLLAGLEDTITLGVDCATCLWVPPAVLCITRALLRSMMRLMRPASMWSLPAVTMPIPATAVCGVATE